MAPLCVATDVHRYYGAVKALQGVDLEIETGSLVGVVGPNGSGKTTLFNCLSGHTALTKGRVEWRGADITKLGMHQVAGRGLVRTFQQSMQFPSTTVAGNVQMALNIAETSIKGDREGLREWDVDSLVDFVGLTELADRPAAVLGHGPLRQLGIALALAARPFLLLLDEPAAGLNSAESEVLVTVLRKVSGAGVTIAVVDHDMAFLMPLVDRLVVLAAGKKLAEGPPTTVQRDPAVIEAYLGTRFAHNAAGNGDNEGAHV